MSIFWDTILPLISERGISQVELASALNKHKGTINNWIKYDRIPPADYALKIADFLGEDLRYLITGERSDEVVFQYKNSRIRPIVDLLEDKPDDIINQVHRGVVAILAAIGFEDKKTDHKKEIG